MGRRHKIDEDIILRYDILKNGDLTYDIDRDYLFMINSDAQAKGINDSNKYKGFRYVPIAATNISKYNEMGIMTILQYREKEIADLKFNKIQLEGSLQNTITMLETYKEMLSPTELKLFNKAEEILNRPWEEAMEIFSKIRLR